MELWFKLTALGFVSGAAFLFGWPHQSLVIQGAVFLGTIHILLFLLEKKQMRSPWMNNIGSVLDFTFVLVAIGETGYLKHFALASLTVFGLFKIKHNLNLIAIAPVATAMTYVALQFFGPFSSRVLIANCAGIFVGLFVIEGVALGITKLVSKFKKGEQTLDEEVFTQSEQVAAFNSNQFAAVYQTALNQTSPEPASVTESPEQHNENWLSSLTDFRPQTEILPEPDMIELRENFRRTKQYCEELEEKAKKDRIAAVLVQSLTQNQESGTANLVGLLRGILGIKSLTLYRYQRDNDTLVVAASTADAGEITRTQRLNISQIKSDVRLRALATNALRNPDDHSSTCPVLLKSNSELIGMLWLSAETNFQLNNARDITEECAELIGNWVNHVTEFEHLRKENAHHYFLESIRRVVAGSETTRTLFTRFVKEMFPNFTLDHLAISMIDGEELLIISSEGASMKAVESLRIEGEIGLPALRNSKFKPLHLEDAQECVELDYTDALKRRVGSYAVVPIRSLNGVEALLTAGTHHRGGISEREFSSLSEAAQLLSNIVQRIEGAPENPKGIISSNELQKLMNSEAGSLILAELVDQESLLERFGASGIQSAMRNFANRTLNLLPNGGAICRRDTDLVIFIPKFNSDSALSWSAELATMTAIWNIPIGTPGNTAPLKIRTKVSTLGKPNNNTALINTINALRTCSVALGQTK